METRLRFLDACHSTLKYPGSWFRKTPLYPQTHIALPKSSIILNKFRRISLKIGKLLFSSEIARLENGNVK